MMHPPYLLKSICIGDTGRIYFVWDQYQNVQYCLPLIYNTWTKLKGSQIASDIIYSGKT